MSNQSDSQTFATFRAVLVCAIAAIALVGCDDPKPNVHADAAATPRPNCSAHGGTNPSASRLDTSTIMSSLWITCKDGTVIRKWADGSVDVL